MQRARRFGIQTMPEHVSFAEMRSTWELADGLGYDTAWTYDHFYPIVGDPSGSCLEGWIALTALLVQTNRLEGGVLVSCNTYRNPAILAKMASTLDHATGGRAILGIGAGWYELEHDAYGIRFPSAGERVARVGEAAEVLKRLLTEESVNHRGTYYRMTEARCDPEPTRNLPLMIGGGGERKMLRIVARFADIWNTFGSPELFFRKIAVLQGHCRDVGRDPATIEISWAGPMAVTSSPTEKEALVARWAKAWRTSPEEAAPGFLIGSPPELRDKLAEFAEVGVTHFIASCAAPYDHKSIRRFAEEVIQ